MSPRDRYDEQGTWFEKKPRLPGPSAPRAAGRRAFGASWWGRAWVEALEGRARLDPNRLPRGRTYTRSGAVGKLSLAPGEVCADVQGSRRSPYKVRVRVRIFEEAEWERLLEALASQIGHTAALLEGELPPEVAEDIATVGLDLLPGAGEVQPRCSCPDWADPCKHAAAVCYLVADVLDEDPFGVFLLRGRSRDEVLAALRARRILGRDVSSSPADLEADIDEGVLASAAWGDATSRPSSQILTRAASTRQLLAGPGRPTVLGADPPPGSGISISALRRLASDAAARALQLAQGSRATGLELTMSEDLARRAALLLPQPGTAAGANATAGASAAAFAQLARRAQLSGRALLVSALAYRDGGVEGLAALSDSFDPSPAEVATGRRLLGKGAVVRRNRVTRRARQLRLGRDGRWYPFRKDASGTWFPDGAPLSAGPEDGDLGDLADERPTDAKASNGERPEHVSVAHLSDGSEVP